jgi:hypothetical protein
MSRGQDLFAKPCSRSRDTHHASAEMVSAQAIASAAIFAPFHHGKVKSGVPLTLP